MVPSNNYPSIVLLLTLCYACLVNTIELTFELQDKSKDCYYENIEKNTSITLEYQVSDRSSHIHMSVLTCFVIDRNNRFRILGCHWRSVRRRCANRIADQRNSLQTSEITI